jgi:Ca2+-binding EF-hand superfamily protein
VLWMKFDVHKFGFISYQEAENGLKGILDEDAVAEAKPAIKSAFNYARTYCKGAAKYSDTNVDKAELIIFLLAFKQRMEYLQAFNIIDQSGDNKIDLNEFLAAKDKITKWIGPIDNLESEFKNIDTKNIGKITFKEFCQWVIDKNL